MSEDNATTEETKTKKPGVGAVAIGAIKGGATNEEALLAVQAEFPEKRTTIASINWYRNKARSTDPSIPTARELKKQQAAVTEDEAETTPEVDPLD